MRDERMRIELLCPAPPGSRTGNRVTALRWAQHLRALGNRVDITHDLYDELAGDKADVLIAMHADKCARAVRHFRKRHADRPLVVALTGTDLYRDLNTKSGARNSLELANRIVLLQSAGLAELEPQLRHKCHVIHQSSVPVVVEKFRRARAFRVCVVGHLRAVKDPMRCAFAVRSLPSRSKIQVDHLGQAMTEAFRNAATREMRNNPRYHWRGNRSHASARRLIARSHLLVLTSRMEGGANVISEACVAGTPILTTRIDGSIGLLGENHPGMFEIGDTNALRALLLRCENDLSFYERLCRASLRKAKLFAPERERASWRSLLRTLR